MWDPIVSVPDHCLSFFILLVTKIPLRKFWFSLILTVSKHLLATLVLCVFFYVIVNVYRQFHLQGLVKYSMSIELILLLVVVL